MIGQSVSRRSWGFTLIEMLVVIGLLAVLAALTFPVASSVKRSQLMIGCRENMRQMVQALKMYESDGSVLPPYLSYYDPAADTEKDPLKRGFRDGRWPLRAYVRDTNIFHCPADNANKDENYHGPGVDAFGNDIQGLEFYYFDSYTGQIDQSSASDGKYHITYSLNRPVDQFPNNDPNRRRLLQYRLKPETTVVTWCAYHRNYDRDKENKKTVQRNSEDIVVFWSGTAQQIPADATIAGAGFQTIGN